MNRNSNENEVSTVESSAPQTNMGNTEATSVSSPTTNFTTNRSSRQDDKEAILAIKSFIQSRQATKPTKPNFFIGKSFSHSKLGQYIIDNSLIKRIHGVTHAKNKGIYVYDNELIEFIITRLVPSIKPADKKLVLDYLTISTKRSEVSESPYNLVGFANGVYNIETSEFAEYPTNDILTSKLNIDYVTQDNNSADIEEIDRFFNKLAGGNPQLKEFLLFIVGINCCRANIPKLLYVLKGNSSYEGVTAKSTFLGLITAILGESSSNYSLEELADKNATSLLYAKTCNISDVSFKPDKLNFTNFRNLISGNTRIVKTGYGTLTFAPYTTMILNVENMSDVEDTILKLSKNFKVIPLTDFDIEDNFDVDVLYKKENLLYITLKALDVVKKFVNSKRFIVPDIVETTTLEYLSNYNSVVGYCKDYPIEEVYPKELYFKQYQNWCKSNNVDSVCYSEFGKGLDIMKYKPDRKSYSNKKYHYYFNSNFNADRCREQYADALSHVGYVAKEDTSVGYLCYFLAKVFEDRHNGNYYGQDKKL